MSILFAEFFGKVSCDPASDLPRNWAMCIEIYPVFVRPVVQVPQFLKQYISIHCPLMPWYG